MITTSPSMCCKFLCSKLLSTTHLSIYNVINSMKSLLFIVWDVISTIVTKKKNKYYSSSVVTRLENNIQLLLSLASVCRFFTSESNYETRCDIHQSQIRLLDKSRGTLNLFSSSLYSLLHNDISRLQKRCVVIPISVPYHPDPCVDG